MRPFQLSAYILGQIPGDFCQKIEVSFIGKIAKSIKGNFSGVYVASKTEFTNNGKGNGNTDGVRIENYPGEFFCAGTYPVYRHQNGTDANFAHLRDYHRD